MDWIKVNTGIARENFGCGDDVAIAIDPLFISKSCRLTYGIGRFWSGVAQRVKRGLEIMEIGAISLSKHTCVMLGAVQSPDFRTLESERHMSMLDWYVALVRSKATELLSLTDILVADAFFSKYEFVNEVIGMGFRFVGRLRANSYLRYLAIPDSSAPCRRVVVCPVENGEPLLYFSTDTDMRPEKIIDFYRIRFQIEFGTRDAKQFTGLQSQQTWDRDRLDFAFNLSFTALNACKEVIRKDYPSLSLAQFKRLIFESYLKIIQKINHRLTQLAA